MALTEQQIVALRRWAEAVASISPYQQERIVIMCEELLTLRAERDTLRATVAAKRDIIRRVHMFCIAPTIGLDEWDEIADMVRASVNEDILAAVPTATPAPDGRDTNDG